MNEHANPARRTPQALAALAAREDEQRPDRDAVTAKAVPMRHWQGKTPDGHALVIERDKQRRWVVTLLGAIRSRGYSLEAALLEAGGASVSSAWAPRVAAAITAVRSEPGEHSCAHEHPSASHEDPPVSEMKKV